MARVINDQDNGSHVELMVDEAAGTVTFIVENDLNDKIAFKLDAAHADVLGADLARIARRLA